MNKGFTLLEILITLTLLTVLSVIAFTTLNPRQQITKAWDAQRKTDLYEMKKAFDSYADDKGYFPPASQVCHDNGNWCHICRTTVTTPFALSHYLKEMPCDPEASNFQYLYHVDIAARPTEYEIYIKLKNTADPLINAGGCSGGCGHGGVYDNYSYNYGATSGNVELKHSP
jgi:prepilin-type N-terminal cleavage/methylation domain-containing protein